MKKYVFSILAMSALVIAACNKELTENDQVVSEEPGVEYEFTATLDDDMPETAASVVFDPESEDKGKVIWNSDDKIAVWNGATSSFVEFSVKALSDGGKTATFYAEVGGTPSFGKAYYPASIAGNTETSVVLPSSYASTTAAADGFPMMSDTVTPGQPVTFKHLGSFLKLTLTGLPAGSDNLTVTASGASLAGTFTASFNGGVPTLTATSGTDSLTVPATSGDNTVYLPVPAGTYGFEIVVKNSSGRNLFRKSASSRTFSRATLKSLKPLPYASPSKYYVKTVSHTHYWDRSDVRMIRTESDKFEIFENCDGDTMYYIYDEFNMDHPEDGCLASGKARPSFSGGNSSWGIVGDAIDGVESWTPSSAVAMTYEGDWHFAKNVRFTKEWPQIKFIENKSWSNQYGSPVTYYGGNTGNDIYVGNLSSDAPYEIATGSASPGNIYVGGVTVGVDYDLFLNPSTGQVYIYASADEFDPNGADGYYQITFIPSTGTASHSRRGDKLDEPFGNIGFPTDEFCISGTFNGWGVSQFDYNGNMSWSYSGLSVSSAGTYEFKVRASSGWTYEAGINSGLGASLYGTLKGDNGNASVNLEAGEYNVYLNTTESWYYLVMFEKQ